VPQTLPPASDILTLRRLMAQKATSPTRTLVFALLGLTALVAVGFGLRSLFRSNVDVHAASVTYENLTSTTPTNGKVQPVEPFDAHAPMAGTVDRIYVGAGEKVKAGQLLIHMNDAEALGRLATAQSALAGAQATIHDMESGGSTDERIGMASDLEKARLQEQQAQRDLTALQQLQQKGAASGSEVLAAQQRLENAKSSLIALEQRSSPASRYSNQDRTRVKAQAADASAYVASARKLYNQLNVRAPFDGTIYSLPIQESDFVPAGETLLSMANLDRIQITAYFDEPDVGKLAVNQAVSIVWEAKPGKVWHGHVETVPTTIINYGTRNVGECIISVDDAHGDLLPNTNVTVTVTILQHPHVLAVPREALHTQGSQSYVFRIVNGKLVRTPVQVGAAVTPTRIEIAGGLSVNDKVAVNSVDNSELTDGLPVDVVQ
jgi:HlyD family secretion protein